MTLSLLTDLWDDSEAAGLDEAGLLTYRSNLLGRDLRLTNFGGGNTSAKIMQTDPLTGEQVEVLWVKGSGGDLGTIRRDGFATLYMDKLRALQRRYRGLEHEDEMVGLYPLCTFGLNARAASIDTPLHAFLTSPHVDHLHPDWAIALAACANGPAQLARLRDQTGLNLVWLPWKRPGFELGLWLQRAEQENPNADGIILGSHGIFTWGPTARESYLNTLRVIDAIGQYVLGAVAHRGSALFGGQAVQMRSDAPALLRALFPALREAVGPAIGQFSADPDTMRFINSQAASELAWQGTSCPDHFVRTKVRPLFVSWNPETGTPEDLRRAALDALPAYREDYAAYYRDCRHDDSPAMRPANPTVVLVPGLGMFSFGKNLDEARRTGEFYRNAIHVMEGATALDDLAPDASIPAERICRNYVALSLQEAFNIEYWLLEEAKLQRMPAEKALSRKIAVMVGASAGIGRAIVRRLAEEGAHVVVADLRPDLSEAIARDAVGWPGSAPVIFEHVDCTCRESVRALFDRVVERFGGVDILVQNAAIFVPPAEDGRITDDQWRKTFDVNVLGTYIGAEEAFRVMSDAGSAGAMALISSANAVVAKPGSAAYDAGKSAVNHLVRELAVTYAPNVRVNGVAPASVVEGSVQFPRERVLTSLAKYGVDHDPSASTEDLRAALADYYSRRTLLKKRVTPESVAEAVFSIVSDRFSTTTGQIIPVDAGIPEAFLR